MYQSELSQLKRTLTEQGYSRSYVRRLIAEIEDHYGCMLADKLQSSGKANSRRADELRDRMGNANEIATAVFGRPELLPIAKRFPLSTFIALPSILLVACTLLVIWLATSISNSLPAGSEWSSGQLADSIAMLNLIYPVLVVASASLIASRARIPLWFPVASAVVMFIGAMCKIDMDYCAATERMVCFQSWGIDSAKLALIAGTLVCCLGLASRLEVESFEPSDEVV